MPHANAIPSNHFQQTEFNRIWSTLNALTYALLVACVCVVHKLHDSIAHLFISIISWCDNQNDADRAANIVLCVLYIIKYYVR